jgi:hypothetical protein
MTLLRFELRLEPKTSFSNLLSHLHNITIVVVRLQNEDRLSSIGPTGTLCCVANNRTTFAEE